MNSIRKKCRKTTVRALGSHDVVMLLEWLQTQLERLLHSLHWENIPDRDGSWKEEGVLVGIYRRLKTLKLLGMTSSWRMVPWNWMVLRREFNHASSDLEKHVQPAMESAGLKWTSGSQPKSLSIADTEIGGLVRRWGTLLTNLASSTLNHAFPAGPHTFAGMGHWVPDTGSKQASLFATQC